MANLAFPQLSSGALAQYPLRRRRMIQSPANAFADGSMVTSNINANSQFVWELSYTELTTNDQSAIQNHFTACQGPFQPFIFIDPTDNMLSQSVDLTLSAWQVDPELAIQPGAADPIGGSTAFMLVNSGQVDQRLTQIIAAPANFQYCFSLFTSAPSPTLLSLELSAASSQSNPFAVSNEWVRLIYSGKLTDEQLTFNASIVVPAAQSVIVFGPQLEPQLRPSRYRATADNGGVYQNAHFLGNSITFESDAPGLFSTLISIETT